MNAQKGILTKKNNKDVDFQNNPLVESVLPLTFSACVILTKQFYYLHLPPPPLPPQNVVETILSETSYV